jgi:hypothetical protein
MGFVNVNALLSVIGVFTSAIIQIVSYFWQIPRIVKGEKGLLAVTMRRFCWPFACDLARLLPELTPISVFDQPTTIFLYELHTHLLIRWIYRRNKFSALENKNGCSKRRQKYLMNTLYRLKSCLMLTWWAFKTVISIWYVISFD